MSDSDINAIESTDQTYIHYRLTSDEDNSEIFVRTPTTINYCDTCKNFGWGKNYAFCMDSDFDNCNWNTEVRIYFDTISTGDNCNYI